MQELPGNDPLSRQIRAQRQSTRQMTADAVRGLRSLLEPQVSIAGPGDATLLAALAVGRSLGVVIKAPHCPGMANEDGCSDPFESIARASHLRIRPVRLRDGWWKEDCGPLLAYRKEAHLPVALLPRKPGRYECFDPISRSGTPVTAHNEGQLER